MNGNRTNRTPTCILQNLPEPMLSITKELNKLKGNCHELRMHLSKFVCGNMPGFLPTFRSRNLLYCLELSLSLPKARYMRAVLP